MKNPKISVVMPVYNAEKHLRESIDSVLEQTFSDFELIIVNDGSTDSSLEILKSYQDPRIKILNNKHSFIDSLNKGVSAANGEYIARMDSDDIMFPYKSADTPSDRVIRFYLCKDFGGRGIGKNAFRVIKRKCRYGTQHALFFVNKLK